MDGDDKLFEDKLPEEFRAMRPRHRREEDAQRTHPQPGWNYRGFDTDRRPPYSAAEIDKLRTILKIEQ